MRSNSTTNIAFSQELNNWLKSNGDKTIGDLQKVFGEKSFAILFLIFMFIPSLPIPTGGITNFVLIPTVMVGAIQMTFGSRTLWLPWFMKRIKLGDKTLKSGLPFMIKRIQWLEKLSKPRLPDLIKKSSLRSLIGLNIIMFAGAAWVAPPFSWLDTLPSLGVVLISLSILLEDILFYVAGIVAGAAGIGLIIVFFDLVISFVQKLF